MLLEILEKFIAEVAVFWEFCLDHFGKSNEIKNGIKLA